MTNPLYPDATTLADCFRNLILENYPPDRAIRKLIADIRSESREFVFAWTYPSFATLRWPFELFVGADDRLRVKTADGREYDADELLLNIMRGRGVIAVLSPEPLSAKQAPSVQAIPPAPISLRDRALARLVEKLKRDQARVRVKPVPVYKDIFRRAFRDLSGRDVEAIWREAKKASGVGPIARGRRKNSAAQDRKKNSRRKK